jgi:hypothetical protein
MILEEKNEKPFEQCSHRTMIWLLCDYCGITFSKTKKQIIKSHKNIDKDACPKCANLKRKEVFKLLHGNENYFLTEEFAKKSNTTNENKYGTPSYFSSQDFAGKRKQSLLKNYGVESPLQSKNIRIKQQQTTIERYGVSNYSQADDFVEKRNTTCLEKYGTSSAMQNEKVKNKRNESCLSKYGVANYVKTSEYWDRRKKTCLAKYGVEHPHQDPATIKKMKNTNIERYGVDSPSKLEASKQRYRDTCLKKYGVPSTLCIQDNRKFGQTQQEVGNWLNGFGFSFKSNYDILNGKEIDLYDGDANLAIEYCGLYWHNECSPQPRYHKYHYKKYVECLNNGIQLITIFEDEWKLKNEQCKSILLSKLNKYEFKTGGRLCKIMDIDKQTAASFYDQYHLLGKSRHPVFCTGLQQKNNLLAVMSLGRHPRNGNVLAMDRLCFKSGCQIVGGASKLFHRCVKWCRDNGYKSILTWSDNRWSNGTVYEQMEFVLDAELPPDYSYINIAKPYVRISKQSQKKSNTGCPTNKTEHQFALENGLARIWDCGKKRWRFDI